VLVKVPFTESPQTLVTVNATFVDDPVYKSAFTPEKNQGMPFEKDRISTFKRVGSIADILLHMEQQRVEIEPSISSQSDAGNPIADDDRRFDRSKKSEYKPHADELYAIQQKISTNQDHLSAKETREHAATIYGTHAVAKLAGLRSQTDTTFHALTNHIFCAADALAAGSARPLASFIQNDIRRGGSGIDAAKAFFGALQSEIEYLETGMLREKLASRQKTEASSSHPASIDSNAAEVASEHSFATDDSHSSKATIVPAHEAQAPEHANPTSELQTDFKNDNEAAAYYRKMAWQGHATAQYMMGLFHQEGRGSLAHGDYEAAIYYHKSASQGNPEAQYKMGDFYEYGRGKVPQSDHQAVRYYRKSAAQGNAAAQYRLGAFHARGRGGLEKNLELAASYYTQSAQQGNRKAQIALDTLGEAGRFRMSQMQPSP